MSRTTGASCFASGSTSAIAFPKDTAAAVGAEMKADLEPAVGNPAVDLVFAFDPHLALQPAAAVMNNCAGATLAGFAMTDIHAVRLPQRDRPQLSAMTFRDPLHRVLPDVPPRRFLILALATGGVEPLDPPRAEAQSAIVGTKGWPGLPRAAREGTLGAERVERRLAAILAADVAGYSRLMEEDEAGTLASLNPDSPDEIAFEQLRAPIPIVRSNSYAGSSTQILTDLTGERRNRWFR
jgi:hypothetical protein